MNTENAMTKYFLFLFILMTQPLYSQPNPEWVMRYDNLLEPSVKDMCVDKQGNVYLAGFINSSPKKLVTIKYNTSGAEAWVKTVDSVLFSDGSRIFISVNNTGEVYVLSPGTIYVQSIALRRQCTRLIKYSSDGDLLWDRRYMNEDSLYAICKAMVLDDSSNIYTEAETYSEGHSSNYTTLKYDRDGNFKWVRIYDNPFHTTDFPETIAIDKNNNVYVSGGNLSTKPVTIKYSSLGDSLWVSVDSIMAGEKIIIDNNLNMYFGATGYTESLRNNIKLAKYDSNRNLFWNRIYDNPSLNNGEVFSDFIIDKNGNSYITGISGMASKLRSDFATIKYNSFGDTLWVRRFSPVQYSNDEPSSIAVDKQGNCIVTGRSDYNLLGYKYMTVVYSPSGQQKYILTYNNNLPNLNHEAIKVLTDTSGNYYVTGNSATSGGINGIATLKYSAITNIQQTSTLIPEKFELMQNYPNPFNPNTIINYQLTINSFVILYVYDINGKLVKELVNKNQTAGNYSIDFDGSGHPSGTYIYRLQAGDFSETKKMVLIK